MSSDRPSFESKVYGTDKARWQFSTSWHDGHIRREENEDERCLQPNINATMNNYPARFPNNVKNQCFNMSKKLQRPWIQANVVNIQLPVARSVPVRMIITKPVVPCQKSWRWCIGKALYTIREVHSSDRPNQTWSVVLEPGRALNTQVCRVREPQQHPRIHGADEDLVHPHMRLLSTGTRDELGGFSWCVGLHVDCVHLRAAGLRKRGEEQQEAKRNTGSGFRYMHRAQVTGPACEWGSKGKLGGKESRVWPLAVS